MKWGQMRENRGAGYEASTCIVPLDVIERSELHTQYCSSDKIEKNGMGGACSAYGGEERGAQGFGGET